ncbi:MAG: hypothetical protein NDJ89_07330 [Oligoflexia bacterium]|nr:hypothetical protein [Oligoflexia bacterium]
MRLAILLSVFLLAPATALSASAERAEAPCEGILIHQDGPFTAAPGETAVYSIRIANVGPCAMEGVSLIDYIPRRTSYLEALPPPASAGPAPLPTNPPRGRLSPADTATLAPEPLAVERVEWSPIALKPGSAEAERYVLKVRIEGPGSRTITNTACLEHERIGRICDVFDTYVK